MYTFVLVMHALICVLLMTIILMQSGRGGGLTESFSAAESLFGAKTNVVLVKATAVLAAIFLSTCLGLAFLSSSTNKSLMRERALTEEASSQPPAELPVPTNAEKSEQPAAAQPAQEQTNQQQPETQNVAVPSQTTSP